MIYQELMSITDSKGPGRKIPYASFCTNQSWRLTQLIDTAYWWVLTRNLNLRTSQPKHGLFPLYDRCIDTRTWVPTATTPTDSATKSHFPLHKLAIWDSIPTDRGLVLLPGSVMSRNQVGTVVLYGMMNLLELAPPAPPSMPLLSLRPGLSWALHLIYEQHKIQGFVSPQDSPWAHIF